MPGADGTARGNVDWKQDQIVEHLAGVLSATPGLRAKFFANPTGEIGKRLPPLKYWNYGPRTTSPLWRWPWNKAIRERWACRESRARLAEAIFRQIASQV